MDAPGPPRRRFLRYLLSSPLFSAVGAGEVIQSPEDALNALDFDPAARALLPPAHYGNLATGVEDDRTLGANVESLQAIRLRPRRLVNIAAVDTRIRLFGEEWATPLYLNPCGQQKMYHPEGELAVARAARAHAVLPVLSTVTTCPVEEVSREFGRPVWFQSLRH